MNSPRRLGRGLEALLGRPLDDAAPTDSGGVSSDNGLVSIDVFQIDPNRFQPREDFNDQELDALAESIRQHGVIQPVVVRRVGERFELISGERRLRAAIKAGWAAIPCLVRHADDRQVAEVAIVENVQRKDLNPLEKAASFQRYLEQYQCTQEELASRIQMDRSTIANLIRLLELPAEIQQSIRQGTLSQGHARALLPLGDEVEQVRFAQKIIAEQLSVRQTEELVQDTIRAADHESLATPDGPPTIPAKPNRRRTRSQHLASLEQELRAALGTKVEIRHGAKGRGKIVVHFASADEFERLRQLIAAPPSLRLHSAAG